MPHPHSCLAARQACGVNVAWGAKHWNGLCEHWIKVGTLTSGLKRGHLPVRPGEAAVRSRGQKRPASTRSLALGTLGQSKGSLIRFLSLSNLNDDVPIIIPTMALGKALEFGLLYAPTANIQITT